MSVSIAVVLDTRRIKKSGKYPVKLRVIVNRKPCLFPTIYELTEMDYNKLEAPRVSESLQHIRNDLRQIDAEARTLSAKIIPFNLKEFEEEYIKSNPLFKQRSRKVQPFTTEYHEFDITPYLKRFPILKEEHPGKEYISATFTNYIKQLLEEQRIGTALSYHNAYVSLKKFRGNVPFSEITKGYLTRYENWMINEKKCSKATVGINLRPLRAMFNEAIDNGIIRREKYPFGKRKYRIPSAKKVKKALKMEDVQKVFEYDPQEENHKKAKAYWVFCYLGNGMNPKDFANLKYKNIDGSYLHFIRAKTERSTQDDPRIITVYLNEDMKDIIKIWGNKDTNPDNYIFPIIHPDDSVWEQYKRVTVLSKFICDCMHDISEAVNLSLNATNMVCRHTYATIMKRSGASTEFIQEALGHTDKKTTENYLDSFEKEVKREFAAKLVAFKKKPVIQKLEKEAIS